VDPGLIRCLVIPSCTRIAGFRLQKSSDLLERYAGVGQDRGSREADEAGDVVLAVPAGCLDGIGDHTEPVVVPDAAFAAAGGRVELTDSHAKITNFDAVTRSRLAALLVVHHLLLVFSGAHEGLRKS